MSNNKSFKRYLAIIVVFVVFSIVFIQTTSATVTAPTNVYFGLPSYGTYINFNPERTFNTIYRDSDYWYFNDYALQVQNGNITISTFFSDATLTFTVTGNSGVTSTTRIYLGEPVGWTYEPQSVEGATSWSYDVDSRTITINVLHSSSKEIEVYWSANPRFSQVVVYFLPVIALFVGIAFLGTFGLYKAGQLEGEEVLYIIIAVIVILIVTIMFGY